MVYWSLALWVVAGALVCIIMTPRYRAVGEIEVAKQNYDGLGLQSMMPTTDTPSDAMDANITLQTQANILQSDSLALRVIEKLNLEQTRDFRPHFQPGRLCNGGDLTQGPRTARSLPGGFSAPPHPRY